MREERFCVYCGESFLSWPSRKKRFCSHPCFMKWAKGSNGSNWKGGLTRLVYICDYCGEKFTRIQKGRFCSRECYDAWQSKNLSGSNSHNYKGEKEVFCLFCGAAFVVSLHSKRKFCSKGCYYVWRSCNLIGPSSYNWQGGIMNEPYCPEFTVGLKEFIKDRDGNKCMNDKCTSESKKLVVHHIDYDKKNCGHDNLITVCNICNLSANGKRNYWRVIYRTAMKNNYGYKYKRTLLE